MKPLRVLMLGPDLKSTSGISAVVNNWFESGLDQKAEVFYVSTLRKYVNGRYLPKFVNALSAYFKVFFMTLRRVDIVHIHSSSYMSFFRKLPVFIWAKLRGLKTIFHVHGSEFDDFYENSGSITRRLMVKVLNSADAVFVLSEYWKKFVQRISKNKNVYIVYNGASLTKFSRKIRNDDEIYVSLMGRLGKRKGVYDLLEVFGEIVHDFPNAHLLLGGDGDVERVKQIVDSKKLEKNIHVLGWVSGSEKLKVFQESDIYVLPSYHEGLPGSILEAMAAGLPVISTPVGGISEAVLENQNGYLVNPGSLDELYTKLKRLCQDRELRERMGKESRELIKEKFDIKKIVDHVLEIYRWEISNETNRSEL